MPLAGRSDGGTTHKYIILKNAPTEAKQKLNKEFSAPRQVCGAGGTIDE